jgi:NAD(P)-dependent dehydrogenase (short-subunit alcohol dehydrogenase family)
MSKILITGAADGLGREAAAQLVRGGQEVFLHARNRTRADEALAAVPGACARSRPDTVWISRTARYERAR